METLLTSLSTLLAGGVGVTRWRQRRSATEADRKPRPSIFEDFDPPEATTAGEEANHNPRPSIFEDFDPPEATTAGEAQKIQDLRKFGMGEANRLPTPSDANPTSPHSPTPAHPPKPPSSRFPFLVLPHFFRKKSKLSLGNSRSP